MDAAHHVLRYLRGTYDQEIVYERSHERVNTLWGWVDSDWAADLDSRRSHTGYILMLTGGAVSWKSRLYQTCLRPCGPGKSAALISMWFSCA